MSTGSIVLMRGGAADERAVLAAEWLAGQEGQEPGRIRVARDDISRVLGAAVAVDGQAPAAPIALAATVRALLLAGWSVIVDETDHSDAAHAAWVAMCAETGAPPPIPWDVDEFDSPTRELPIGRQEIAVLLGVAEAAVDQWRARGIFCSPDGKVSGRPVWWPATVVAWAHATGRALASTQPVQHNPSD